jgi:hypothetical protein
MSRLRQEIDTRGSTDSLDRCFSLTRRCKNNRIADVICWQANCVVAPGRSIDQADEGGDVLVLRRDIPQAPGGYRWKIERRKINQHPASETTVAFEISCSRDDRDIERIAVETDVLAGRRGCSPPNIRANKCRAAGGSSELSSVQTLL